MSTCNRCDGQGAYETAASRGEGTHEICSLCNGTGEQPAPVSATEPEVLGYWRDDACKRADLDADDIVSDISVSVAREIVTHIATLRARVAELERVTEASRDSVREEFKQILRDDSSSYPRIVYPSNDVCDEIVRLRAALTAARGGG